MYKNYYLKEQEMNTVQKMDAAEIVVQINKSNIENMLIARKNIIKIKKVKRLIIFRIIFEKSKKILKFNDF